MQSSVSIVMSAYCDSQGLLSTVESIFQQRNEASNTDLLLELIIVDDGAEQSVKETLRDLQNQHAELLVISQENMGLTKSLITACDIAKYDYIARVDVGDRMLATRLRKQIDFLDNHSDVVALATWANTVTPEGYPLYHVRHSDKEVQTSLQPLKLDSLLVAEYASPPHFTMMFRKQTYQLAEGYRPEFYFTQDFDLWLRMSEHGVIRVLQEALTESTLSANSLSGANNQAQQELSQLAWESAVLRRQGESDVAVLKKATLIRPKSTAITSDIKQSKSLYFIAKCLLDQGHFGAKIYFWRTLKKQPLLIKAWLGFVQSLFVNRK